MTVITAQQYEIISKNIDFVPDSTDQQYHRHIILFISGHYGHGHTYIQGAFAIEHCTFDPKNGQNREDLAI